MRVDRPAHAPVAVPRSPAWTTAAVERKPAGSRLKRQLWGLAALFALGTGWWAIGRPVRYPAGMLVGEAPRQDPAVDRQPWTLKDGSRVVPLARYDIKARLLHRERYRFDAMADISPVDFGVGWYRMSDQSVIDGYAFSNSTRFLTCVHPDGDQAGMDAGSIANMHMLPANDRVRERMLSFRAGEIFHARGYLVSVERPGMNPWTSSLSRDDTGMGACEIMWVEEIRPVKPPQTR